MVVLSLVADWFYYEGKIYKNNTAEVGTNLTVEDFLKREYAMASFAADSDSIVTSQVGIYNLRIKLGFFVHSATLTLVDTVAPEGQVQDLTLQIGETCEAEAFVLSYTDATSVSITYESEPDFTKIGEQAVGIVLTDEGNNSTSYATTLTIMPDYTDVYVDINDAYIDESIFVSDMIDDGSEIAILTDISQIDPTVIGDYLVEAEVEGIIYYFNLHVIDTEAPVITGPESKEVYMEDGLAYSKFVVVTDNSGEYELSVDTSGVDATTAGTYTVIYTATDASGNSSSFTMVISLLENEYTTDMVYEYSDAIIADIITDDMTGLEKLRAIYNWVRQHVGYSGDSEKGNWLKAAYEGFRTQTGDCYTYACVTQALLNSAGIDNMMIEKIPTSTKHYWNLVDIGDGWYHLDTTPRQSGALFFYITEDELMLYSDNHNGTHNYDHSLYPTVESYEGELPSYEEYYNYLKDTDSQDTVEDTVEETTEDTTEDATEAAEDATETSTDLSDTTEVTE